MARKDQLAGGAARASFLPTTVRVNTHGQTWEQIFGEPKSKRKSTIKPKIEPLDRPGSKKRR